MALESPIVNSNILLELERCHDLLEDVNASIVRHKASDIQTISHLGKGAFCNVSRVISRSTRKQLAMKSLDKDSFESTEQLHKAATDLIMEAHYLSKLDHPNIIKLRGLSSDEEGQGFFITLDIMQETLRDRIPRWYDEKSSFENNNKGLKNRLSGKRKKLNLERMYGRIETAALGMAEAMEYIHGKGIIVRDLKPGNVGFHEETGGVCLLDFGFARELSLCSEEEICGTPRYMAPELLNGGNYSLKTDVYAFGILLHEITSLEHSWRPQKRSMSTHTISSHGDLLTACDTLAKPSTEIIPCRTIALLIQDCISEDPESRPTFEVICMTLKEALSSPSPKETVEKFSLKSPLKSQLEFFMRSNTSIATLPDLSDADDDLDRNEQAFHSSVDW